MLPLLVAVAAVAVVLLAAFLWQWRARRTQARELSEQVRVEKATVAHLRSRERALAEEAESARTVARQAQETNQMYAAEANRLATERIPLALSAVAAGLDPTTAEPGLAHETLAGGAVATAYEEALKAVGAGVDALRHEIHQAGAHTIAGIVQDPAAALVRTQHTISLAMQGCSDDMRKTLIDIDASVALAQHRMQRMGVACGSWPGLQRDHATIATVLAAALPRVASPELVSLAPIPRELIYRGVEAGAVEALTIAVAEFLDNATAFSNRPVRVDVVDTVNGCVVVIDDRGRGASATELASLNAILEGGGRDLLSVVTPTLGLDVIARLAKEYGFSARLRDNHVSGLTASLMIPGKLLREVTMGESDLQTTTERLANPSAGRESAAIAAPPPPTDVTSHGLPIRQRGGTEPTARPPLAPITDNVDLNQSWAWSTLEDKDTDTDGH